MKKLITLFIITLIVGCSKTPKDITGVWTDGNDGELTITKDGSNYKELVTKNPKGNVALLLVDAGCKKGGTYDSSKTTITCSDYFGQNLAEITFNKSTENSLVLKGKGLDEQVLSRK